MRLLIISHTPHYQGNDAVVGWGPTIREIDQLATLFDEVVHLAPLYKTTAPKSALPYTAENVRYTRVKPAGGDRLLDKLQIMQRIPGWLAAMKKEIQQADYVHIRCPASISLVALLAARWWAKGKPTWVKYAGNWQMDERSPLSSKVQRWYINKNLHKGVVSINGSCENTPGHIYSLYNPSYAMAEYKQIAQAAKAKTLTLPINLIFVGRIERAKGVDQVIRIAKGLKQEKIPFKLILVGDGKERFALEEYVHEQRLEKFIRFTGWLPMTALTQYYLCAHFLILPSKSEGWPKVLSEAMAHGVVPLASSISSIPVILGKIGAGHAIPRENQKEFIDTIVKYTQDINTWKKASIKGIEAGKLFTYEHYLADIKIMLKQCFHIELTHV